MTAAETQPELRIAAAMLSHVGRVRAQNEDAVLFVAPREGAPERRKGFLALVADGMGGHAAGEVASALATEVIQGVVHSSSDAPDHTLRRAFEAANDAILAHGAKYPETAGMGTTCTAILIRDDRLWLAHIGDSRAYLLRNGRLTQISQDQTLHAELIRHGVMTPAAAAASPGRNFLLQALGARENLEPLISAEGRDLSAGDIVLLCSDGLHTHVRDQEIAATLAVHGSSPQQACRELIETALERGGSDNISVGVVALLAPAAAPERDTLGKKFFRKPFWARP
jgi:PPM family protein phosphatase